MPIPTALPRQPMGVRTLAFPILVLTLAVLSPPVRAAHWAITYVWSGATTLTLIYPGLPTRVTSVQWTSAGPTYVHDTGYRCPNHTLEAKGTVTATATWTADTSDPSPVPAPPQVIIYETAAATWAGSTASTGKAVDGLPGDTEIDTVPPTPAGGTCQTLQIAYPTYSGATVTLPTRSIDVSTTTTSGEPVLSVSMLI